MDHFKYRLGFGPGGPKCKCCKPVGNGRGKSKKLGNRIARARVKAARTRELA